MGEERKNAAAWPWIVGLLVLLPVAYVGTYVYAVDRGPLFHRGPDVPGAIKDWPPYYGLYCPVGGNVFIENQVAFKQLFAPLHWVDRRLRPTHWRTYTKGP
jgi:hypothetical protein